NQKTGQQMNGIAKFMTALALQAKAVLHHQMGGNLARRTRILRIVMLGIAFVSTPVVVHAQQIVDPTCTVYPDQLPTCLSGNSSTIIVGTPGAYNSWIPYSYTDSSGVTYTGSFDTFNNVGTIEITGGGTMNNSGATRTNRSTGTLTNNGKLVNASYTDEYGTLWLATLTNEGTLINAGTLSNKPGGTLTNAGTLNN